jgi:NADPH:quinone reductase-like Zn-dependent oxidoreductase
MSTGGVSITGLLVAKAAGATTIVTSSSDEKLESIMAKFGFDYGVNYKRYPEWSKEVLRLTGGEGVDYVLENGGSGTIAESINAVKMGGNVSVIGLLSQAKEMPDVLAWRSLKAQWFAVSQLILPSSCRRSSALSAVKGCVYS